jgi:LCP family protein required for cell wall assembly
VSRRSLPLRAGRRLRRVTVAAALCAALAGAAATAGPGPLTAEAAALALPRTTVFSSAAHRPANGPGVNYLLVGIDRRAGLSRQERKTLHVGGQGCDCTDVMMLMHVSADHRRVSVLSIPRDSYVRFPQDVDRTRLRKPLPKAGKINGAFAVGGAALTVRTVEQATGVRVDHYLQADFGSFVRTVDRLGGATVCTPTALHDVNSGLHLSPGVHRLDGHAALRYVRARHVVPSGDLGRMRRQQRFFAEMIDEWSDRGVFSDPVALARTAATLHDSLVVDRKLSVSSLTTLGRALRRLTTADAEFATVPITDFDHRVPGWGSTLVWDHRRAAKLFKAINQDRPLTDRAAYRLPGPGRPVAWPPSKIQVRVHPAAGSGRAATALEKGLRGEGFTVLARPVDVLAAPPQHTRIRFAPHWERQARALSVALPGAVMVPVKGHERAIEVRPAAGQQVGDVVFDRSSVQGRPVGGDTLDCDGQPLTGD